MTLTLVELEGEHTVVDLERGVVGTGANPRELFDSLVAVLDRLAEHTDPLRLHLRAASVELPGASPAARGPGLVLVDEDRLARHELVCLLLERGARYLSADATVLLPGSRTTFASPGPLLVSRARPWMADGAASDRLGVDHGELDGHVWMAASAVGGPPCPATRSRLVAFVRHEPGASASLRELGTVEGCARLLRDSGALDSFGPDALDVVAALAAESRFVEVVHDDERRAADLLVGLDAPPGFAAPLLTRRDRAGEDGATAGRDSLRLARFGAEGAGVPRAPCSPMGPAAGSWRSPSAEADALDARVAGAEPAAGTDELARVRAAGVDLQGVVATTGRTRGRLGLGGRSRRREPTVPLAAIGLPGSPGPATVPENWSRESTALVADAWRSGALGSVHPGRPGGGAAWLGRCRPGRSRAARHPA